MSYILGLDLLSAELELHNCCQISAIQNRDDELHVACAAFMVYRAVVGSEAPAHSDMRSFLSGFCLPTWNGFSLPKVSWHY